MSMFSTVFIIIMITIGVARIVNWLNEFVSTIPIKEANDGPRLYIKKDLENGRIY